MTQIQIGKHKAGGFDFPNKVVADGPSQTGLNYEQALNVAKSSAGADMIVPQERDGSFSYDVYAVTIVDKGVKENKKVITGDKALKLVDNVPGTFNASETFLVDQNSSVGVLMPKGKDNDLDKGRRAITHAKARDLAGATALTSGISNGGMRTQLTGLFDALKNEKGHLEQREGQLRRELQAAEQAFANKRIAYDQAIGGAKAQLSNVTSHHANVVAQKSEDLREAQRPGVRQAEAEVARQRNDVSAAEGKLSRAQTGLNAARRKFDEADQLKAEREQIKTQLPRVREQLRDYEEGVAYKNKYGEYPANWHEVPDMMLGRVYKPISWDQFDTEAFLQARRDRLENRKSYIDAREPQLRAEARREKDRAQDEVRYAERDVSDAKSRLYAAEQALMYLPVGSPAQMEAAQRALDNARSDQTRAVGAAQGRLSEAETAWEVNTRRERNKVDEMKLALQSAPNQFQQTIDETARRLGL